MTDDLLQYQWVFVRDFDRALRFYIETLGLSSTLAYEGWASSIQAHAPWRSSASSRMTMKRSWSRSRASVRL